MCERDGALSLQAHALKTKKNTLSLLLLYLLRPHLAHDQLDKVGVRDGQGQVGLVAGGAVGDLRGREGEKRTSEV